ncbi:MAG: hypothetical protein P8Y95_02865, partial [Gammaproteobacteria bacterium]
RKALTYVETGQCLKAMEEAESEAIAGSASTSALRAYLNGRCNRPAQAREQQLRLETLAAEGKIKPERFRDWFLAAAHLGLGENEYALSALERMVEAGMVPPWPPAPLDPFWDPLRGDERFADLAERMGLPASL